MSHHPSETLRPGLELADHARIKGQGLECTPDLQVLCQTTPDHWLFLPVPKKGHYYLPWRGAPGRQLCLKVPVAQRLLFKLITSSTAVNNQELTLVFLEAIPHAEQ